MAFTDQSDLFGAIHEDGINLVVQHLMRLRPSLFNYGTDFISKNPQLLCHEISADPMVFARNNPLITVESPLPVLGTNGLINLNYCLQLVDVKIDFHPNNSVQLPVELSPLPEQRFALSARACAGLGCPDDRLSELLEKIMEGFYDAISLQGLINGGKDVPGITTHVPPRTPDIPPITLPTRKLLCFCLEVYAVCHIETRKVGNTYFFTPKLDGIEIVDIAPAGMEDSIECYVKQVIRLGLLPRIRIALEKIVFDQLKIVSIALKPAAAVATNPAIEDDQVKVFIDMEVA